MPNQPTTWEEVFDLMGGPAEVGRAIGTTTEHAAAMKRRGRIPPKYRVALVRDAQARSITAITYQVLAEIDAGIAHESEPNIDAVEA